MATPIRQGGSVYQSAEDFINQLKGAPVTSMPKPPALSPAAAVSQGANDDEAKMAGSRLQKDAALSDLTRQVTAAAPAAQPLSQEQESAAQQAQRLASLGSLGGRVQQLIEQRIANAQQTVKTQIDQDALKRMAGGDAKRTAAATGALQAYLQGGQTEAQLAALIDALGASPGSLSSSGVATLFKGGEATLTEAIKNAKLNNQVTLGQLDLAPLGINRDQLAKDLGLKNRAALDVMTLPQLKDALSRTQTTQFSQADSLKAEYINATAARKLEIQQALRQLDAQGVAASEAAVQDLNNKVANAETITWQGKPTTVEQLLGNDQISADISAAVNNPERLKELAKYEPGLAKWITNNLASLKSVVADAEKDTADLTAAETKLSGIRGTWDPKVFDALIPSNLKGHTLTTKDVADLESTLAKDPIVQAAQTKLADGTTLASKLTSNPGLVADIRKILGSKATAADIVKAMNDTATVAGNKTVQTLLGIDPKKVTILTAAQQKDLASLQSSALWQSAYGKTPNVALRSWLENSSNASVAKEVAKYSAQDLDAATKAATEVSGNPILALLSGQSSSPVLTKAQQKTVADAKKSPLFKTIGSDPNMVAMAKGNKSFQTLLTSVQSGKIQADAAAQAAGWMAAGRLDPNIAGLFKFSEGLDLNDAMQLATTKRAGALTSVLDQYNSMPRDIKSSPALKQLIGAGAIDSASDLEALKDPDRFARVAASINSFSDAQARLNSARNNWTKLDTALDFAFGQDVDIGALFALGDQLKGPGMYNPGLNADQKRERDNAWKMLQSIFGFIPSKSDIGEDWNLSARTQSFMNKLLQPLLNPADIVERAKQRWHGGYQESGDSSLWETLRAFLTGKASLDLSDKRPDVVPRPAADVLPVLADKSPILFEPQIPTSWTPVDVQQADELRKLQTGAINPTPGITFGDS